MILFLGLLALNGMLHGFSRAKAGLLCFWELVEGCVTTLAKDFQIAHLFGFEISVIKMMDMKLFSRTTKGAERAVMMECPFPFSRPCFGVYVPIIFLTGHREIVAYITAQAIKIVSF